MIKPILWKPTLWFEEIPSTQDYLKSQVPPLLDTVVATEHQTKGYGSRARSWVSEPGDWLFSFSLLTRHQDTGRLMACVSLALIETLEMNVSIKPPNDLYLEHLKCGGILIEQKPYHDDLIATIGVGVNFIAKPFLDVAFISPAWTRDVYISKFQKAFNDYLQLPRGVLVEHYQRYIPLPRLQVSYQGKKCDEWRLNDDFTCETEHGTLPMAHLSFEII